jgi:hypothetical protein
VENFIAKKDKSIAEQHKNVVIQQLKILQQMYSIVLFSL